MDAVELWRGLKLTPRHNPNSFRIRNSARSLRTIIFALLLIGSALARAQTEKWKSFSNRAGWTISYPPDWRIDICKSCPDPRDPEASVNFVPPAEKDTEQGWLKVERLGGRPPGMSIDDWFADIKQSESLIPEEDKDLRITLNDLPALKVRFHNPKDANNEIEVVYVLNALQTYSLTFSATKPNPSVESLKNYPVYQRMLASFKVKP
jgi:hypothetical protein